MTWPPSVLFDWIVKASGLLGGAPPDIASSYFLLDWRLWEIFLKYLSSIWRGITRSNKHWTFLPFLLSKQICWLVGPGGGHLPGCGAAPRAGKLNCRLAWPGQFLQQICQPRAAAKVGGQRWWTETEQQSRLASLACFLALLGFMVSAICCPNAATSIIRF